MKRRLAAAGASGAAILIAAVAAPSGAERGYFAATFAPALLALLLPFGLPVERDAKSDAVLPPAAGVAVFLATVGFTWKFPGPGGAAGVAVFLACWAALLTGLFRLGARFGAAAGHLVAGGAGLFLCATHLLADPFVSTGAASVRHALIAFAVNANPSLQVSAGFWRRDLLMTTYAYARSDIGAFHAHGYAPWGWPALAYVAVGVAGWAVGKKAEPADDEE
ncbi:MAG: hypothetical protein K8T20_19520 [Planctomycetes bacterium]|nr:hypothetical protein [Planctomycetota bacterium]